MLVVGALAVTRDKVGRLDDAHRPRVLSAAAGFLAFTILGHALFIGRKVKAVQLVTPYRTEPVSPNVASGARLK
jgi:hypothetical protein